MATMEFKWMMADELSKLDPYILLQGRVPLNPNMSFAIAAMEGDRIVGYSAMSCRPHIDLWVERDHRGRHLADELTDRMVTKLYEVNAPECYLVASNPHVKRLAEHHGMVVLTNPVYYKRGH
jgi:hypothetical protein